MGKGRRYTIDEADKLVDAKGFKLLSKYYTNSQQRLVLRDKEGYLYFTRLMALLTNKIPYKFDKYNPYTIRNIKLFLKLNNFNIELVSGDYNGNKINLTFKDFVGYYYFSNLNNLIVPERILAKFHQNNPYTIQNIKLWCKINNKPFEIISETYDANDKQIKWKCLKPECGEIFEMTWSNIYSNHGCGFCEGMQVGISNCLATLNPKLASEWHPTKNGDLTPFDVTCGSHKEVWWQCKDNPKHEWKVDVKNRNISNSGCPECNKSKGEKECKRVFINKGFIEINQDNYNNIIDKNNNTYFIPQKTFNGLIGLGGSPLSYDFYLPNRYSLLVEYQGEYHDQVILLYKNEPRELAEARLAKQKEHDRRKRKYAQQNGYDFLEIWYWDFDNIEEILNDYLEELSTKDDSFNKHPQKNNKNKERMI